MGFGMPHYWGQEASSSHLSLFLTPSGAPSSELLWWPSQAGGSGRASSWTKKVPIAEAMLYTFNSA